MSDQPRGIRNCNPTNLDYHPSADPWQGLDDPPSDGRFCRFVTPQYGIRAAAVTLRTYQQVHGCHTVRMFIDRWAPPNENDTTAYIQHVSDMIGVTPDQDIDVTQRAVMILLVTAIIWHENGVQPYAAQVIAEGVGMAV